MIYSIGGTIFILEAELIIEIIEGEEFILHSP